MDNTYKWKVKQLTKTWWTVIRTNKTGPYYKSESAGDFDNPKAAQEHAEKLNKE